LNPQQMQWPPVCWYHHTPVTPIKSSSSIQTGHFLKMHHEGVGLDFRQSDGRNNSPLSRRCQELLKYLHTFWASNFKWSSSLKWSGGQGTLKSDRVLHCKSQCIYGLRYLSNLHKWQSSQSQEWEKLWIWSVPA